MSEIIIWMATSDLDRYFVYLFMSPKDDYDEARKRAFAAFSGKDHRPKKDEWKEFHTDPAGLNVAQLGEDWLGSNGDGHIEIEVYPVSEGKRCNLVAEDGKHCRLPIGHGSFSCRSRRD